VIQSAPGDCLDGPGLVLAPECLGRKPSLGRMGKGRRTAGPAVFQLHKRAPGVVPPGLKSEFSKIDVSRCPGAVESRDRGPSNGLLEKETVLRQAASTFGAGLSAPLFTSGSEFE